jgi:tRNA (adenine57-N1/adenine58-N1)-methyltransferase
MSRVGIYKQTPIFFFDRKDFIMNGISHLVTVSVRDIQGQGFPEEHSGRVDAVFLDLPQPWLAIPSASKMLRPDGILCSFSPCIEQVQRTCEALEKQDFSGARGCLYNFIFF